MIKLISKAWKGSLGQITEERGTIRMKKLEYARLWNPPRMYIGHRSLLNETLKTLYSVFRLDFISINYFNNIFEN